MPATPGMRDPFCVTTVRPPRDLVLTVPEASGGNQVSWELLLEPLDYGRTRLIVRGRISRHWRLVRFGSAPAHPAASSSLSASTQYWRTPRGHSCWLPPPLAAASCKPGCLEASSVAWRRDARLRIAREVSTAPDGRPSLQRRGCR
jgi:hypothetical protein